MMDSCECPECGGPAYPRRNAAGVEYRCAGCGETFTRREGSGYYAFFPGHLRAAPTHEVEPVAGPPGRPGPRGQP